MGCLLALFSQGSSISTHGPGAEENPPVRVEIPRGSISWSLHSGDPRPVHPFPRRVFSFPVTVTGYSSTVDQTDSTPFVTASNTRVRRGILALSRDLLREFTPGAPFAFGDRVELKGVGVFVVEDTMNLRFTKRADIWFSSRTAARQWGRREMVISRLSANSADSGIYARSAAMPIFEAAPAD